MAVSVKERDVIVERDMTIVSPIPYDPIYTPSRIIFSSSTFLNRNNIAIFTRTWLPQSEPKAAVLLIHGLYTHTGYSFSSFDYNYEESIIEAYIDAGYAVHSMDFQGMGKSGGCTRRRGHVTDFDEYAYDVIQFMEVVQHAHRPKMNLFIHGNCFGGMVVLRAMVLLDRQKAKVAKKKKQQQAQGNTPGGAARRLRRRSTWGKIAPMAHYVSVRARISSSSSAPAPPSHPRPVAVAPAPPPEEGPLADEDTESTAAAGATAPAPAPAPVPDSAPSSSSSPLLPPLKQQQQQQYQQQQQQLEETRRRLQRGQQRPWEAREPVWEALRGLVLTAPSISPQPGVVPNAVTVALFTAVAHLVPWYPIIDEPDEGEGDAEAALYEGRYWRDPVCHKGSMRARVALGIKGCFDDFKANMEQFEVPFIVVQSAHDVFCNPDGSKQLFHRAQSEDKTLFLIKNMKHNVMLEPGCQDTFKLMTDWLDRRAVGRDAVTCKRYEEVDVDGTHGGGPPLHIKQLQEQQQQQQQQAEKDGGGALK